MTGRISEIQTYDGARITYRLVQGGAARRVIVFLHGLASNMTRWAEFAELTSLQDSWDILLPDLRGHGRSQYRGIVTMEKWCEDIAAILEKEGYTGAVLAGHCLGGNIAINFARLYPERSMGLVLLEPLFSQSFTGVLRRIQPHRNLLTFLITLTRLINLIGIYRRNIPLLDLRELDRNARGLIASAGTPEVLRKRYGAPLHDLRYISMAAYLQSVRELLRPLPQLAEIPIPKLFIFSSAGLFSESKGIDELCGSLMNCDVVKIDSYHWIPTEKPLELRETVERWCSEKFK